MSSTVETRRSRCSGRGMSRNKNSRDNTSRGDASSYNSKNNNNNNNNSSNSNNNTCFTTTCSSDRWI